MQAEELGIEYLIPEKEFMELPAEEKQVSCARLTPAHVAVLAFAQIRG